MPGRFPLALLIVASLVIGCGKKPDGPERFALSGKVTFAGAPVPIGTIRFSPNAAQGNQGPSASTTIRNGEYATYSGRGAIGGPMIVMITGIDSDSLDSENTLFSQYRVEVDIPRESGEQDFDVPASAGVKSRVRR